MLRHVISARQFRRDDLDALFGLADRMEEVLARGGCGSLGGKIMATLFYEPSTRTRLSFEAAMLRLGGRTVSTENAKEYSSVAKGETLEDSIRTVGCYVDVIVLRHFEEGAAMRASSVSAVPIVNAVAGVGEHPTQALLDLYTIRQELRRLDGLTIACIGDLAHGRTVHSLVRLASNFEVRKFIFVAPKKLRMKPPIKDELTAGGIPFAEEDDIAAALAEADVVYQTRVQKERFIEDGPPTSHARYVIDRAAMSLMKPDAVLLHPLPRVGEIAVEVDADPRAAYFRQVRNGLLVRMALLQTIVT